MRRFGWCASLARSPRDVQQDGIGLDAVGAPGAPRQQHRVVADAGPHVGDPLAGQRHDPLERGQHLAVGVDHLSQPGVQGGIEIGPGGEDGARHWHGHLTSS